MIAALGAAAVGIGVTWVTKRLSKPADVSPYFSRNGEYLANVERNMGEFRTAFKKYGSQMPEGSPEAQEYIQIATPYLNWRGERNAVPPNGEQLLIDEGQRLVNQYQSKSIIGKAGDTLNTLTDPIRNFFSFLSLNKDDPQTAYIGVPKTDTLIPIYQTEPVAKAGFGSWPLVIGIGLLCGVMMIKAR